MQSHGPSYPRSRILFSRLIETAIRPFTLLAPKREVPPNDVRRILLLEPFDIGDAASLAVMLRPLREHFPNAEIHLILKPICAELFEGCDLVHSVHKTNLPWTRRRGKLIPKIRELFSMVRTILLLRRIGFDIGIDTRGEIRSQLMMVLAGIPQRVGYTNYLCSNITIRGTLLTHSVGHQDPKPRALLNLELIEALDCPLARPVFPVPFAIRPLPEPRDDRFRVLIHPGAAWEFKQWKPARWVELLDRLTDPRFDIHVIGAPFEKDQLDSIRSRCGGRHSWHATTIAEMMSQIGHSDLFVGNDSGPMHIAEYLGKPVVALFGPANVAVWQPCCTGHSVIHHQEQFPCAPCLQRTCVRPEFNCMDTIAVDEVASAIMAQFEKWQANGKSSVEVAWRPSVAASQEVPYRRFLLTGGSGFIGTNFMTRLLREGKEVLDLSSTPTLDPAHQPFSKECDLLDGESVRSHLRDYAPEVVIHLAARTDCDEKTTVEAGYRVNTDGTANLLAAVRDAPSVRRLIITSSQFVCGPSRLPAHDEDYFPHTVYGQSKVITEQLTRAANLPCAWTIVRPTNIWGPWHERYSREFWRIAARGLYFHPGGAPVIRCYGYVGTIIDQMIQIVAQPGENVNGKIVYLGDPADDIFKWASVFCHALCGRGAPKVPRPVLRIAGMMGDAISLATGNAFYITSSRYRSMVSNYPTRMDKTYALLGMPRHKLDESVRETVNWLRSRGPAEFRGGQSARFSAESE
jgi:ADP-heptose:LPS heptosyltransferase/nucleoside-diphosphate-sugar epimerase